MLEDFLIIKKVKEGDIGAFETLFRKYHSPLLFYCTSITASVQAAEDIVQDLFYNIWKDKERLNILVSVKSYLYKSVRNHSLQYLQKNANRRNNNMDNLDNQTNPTYKTDDYLEYHELEQLLSKSIKSMPERRARIFRMHRYENLKYKEIAQKISLSVKTVEAEMTKALKTLKKEIDISQQSI